MFALTSNIRRSYMASTYSDMLQAHVVAILIPLTDYMISQTACVYQCI